MLSRMRGGGSSCKRLEAKSTEEAVLQDTLNAEVIDVQNVRDKWENFVMRESIRGHKHRDATFN